MWLRRRHGFYRLRAGIPSYLRRGWSPKHLYMPIPSTPQSAAADSSPYEGEPKGSKVAPCGAIKCAAEPQTFFGSGCVTFFGV